MNNYLELIDSISKLIEKDKAIIENYQELKRQDFEKRDILNEEILELEDDIYHKNLDLKMLESYYKNRKGLKVLYSVFGLVSGTFIGVIAFIASLILNNGDLGLINHLINILIGGTFGSAMGVIEYFRDTRYARKHSDESASETLKAEIRDLEERKRIKEISLVRTKQMIDFYKNLIKTKSRSIQENKKHMTIIEGKYSQISAITSNDEIKDSLYLEDDYVENVSKLVREKKE